MSRKEDIQKLRHIAYRLKARLLHHTVLGKALRRAAWKTAGAADGVRVIYRKEYDVFGHHTLNHIQDQLAIRQFAWEAKTYSVQQDIVWLAEGDVCIEPKHSLAFLKGRKFFTPTRSTAHEYLVPGLFPTLMHQTFRRRYTWYPELVHFDGFIGRNLYHFFDESINAYLMLLQTGQVSRDVPLLINARVYQLPYVQYILGLPEFRDLKLVVQQEGEWIHTGRLYKAIATNEYWKQAYELAGRHVTRNPHRRIFLNRSPYYQRRLVNNDAIEALVKSYGFEVVYAEDLTYAGQVQLFAETEYFIGLHGAGVTNLLYADMSRVHVMELFSRSLLHPHYYWFLELLGVHYYDAIVGTPFDINWNYRIDEARFAEQLERMMAHSHRPDSAPDASVGHRQTISG